MCRALSVVLALVLGCPAPGADAPVSPASALLGGAAYLVRQQSPDGAWRSDVYGTFKDGPALTPLVVVALQEAADADAHIAETTARARRLGSDYLAKLARPDGHIDAGESGLDYPVYTASLCIAALSRPENTRHVKARDAWLKYLLDRQLTEALGWQPTDKEFGGWGYCRTLPRKPAPNTIAAPLIESNLSATLFALEALRTAGAADAAVYEKAAMFVRRCQNMPTGQPPRPAHLDGGFHFIYDDPVRNKAGSLDELPAKAARFHSYGSTTADGLRALRLCRQTSDAPRQTAARDWLLKHFRADHHPGTYVASHEGNRDAVYFYYAASVAKALRGAGVTEVGGGKWADTLAAALIARRKPDGSWANPVELVRENDPVVATADAVIALANCLRVK